MLLGSMNRIIIDKDNPSPKEDQISASESVLPDINKPERNLLGIGLAIPGKLFQLNDTFNKPRSNGFSNQFIGRRFIDTSINGATQSKIREKNREIIIREKIKKKQDWIKAKEEEIRKQEEKKRYKEFLKERKKWQKIQTLKEQSQIIKEDNAATIIQQSYRNFCVKRTYLNAKDLQLKNRSVIKIQSLGRSFLGRQRYEKLRLQKLQEVKAAAIVMIQKTVRMFLVVKNICHMKQVKQEEKRLALLMKKLDEELLKEIDEPALQKKEKHKIPKKIPTKCQTEESIETEKAESTMPTIAPKAPTKSISSREKNVRRVGGGFRQVKYNQCRIPISNSTSQIEEKLKDKAKASPKMTCSLKYKRKVAADKWKNSPFISSSWNRKNIGGNRSSKLRTQAKKTRAILTSKTDARLQGQPPYPVPPSRANQNEILPHNRCITLRGTDVKCPPSIFEDKTESTKIKSEKLPCIHDQATSDAMGENIEPPKVDLVEQGRVKDIENISISDSAQSLVSETNLTTTTKDEMGEYRSTSKARSSEILSENSCDFEVDLPIKHDEIEVGNPCLKSIEFEDEYFENYYDDEFEDDDENNSHN